MKGKSKKSSKQHKDSTKLCKIKKKIQIAQSVPISLIRDTVLISLI
jgi:hypothetical protein